MKRQALPRARGFTLIELLVVITIIMVLAGLTLSLFSYANVKAASDRARAEVSALSLALESYKIDNGDYPRDTAGKTDGLDASQNTDATSAAYQAASLVLYKALSGDTNNTRQPIAKVYFPFKSNMLYPKAVVGGTTAVQYIADPFRNAYGYSTLGTATSGSSGYNPTFDLWSTATSDPTKPAPPAAWITNW